MDYVVIITALLLPVVSIFATIWLMSRKPINLTVMVRFVPEDDDPDEDELEPDVLPDETQPANPEVMRFN